MNRINFSWDKSKAQTNLKKHKISFEEAQTVFDDENVRIISARKSTKHEENQYREFTL